MTRAELIQAVALRMDEITPSAGLSVAVDGSDGNPLATLIDGLVDSGVLELFSIAPYWRLKQTAFTDKDLAPVGSQRLINDGDGEIQTRKMIRLKVPDDFLRVAEISHADFQRPITEVVPEQSELGKRQHSPFLMAKEARPVGVMSHGLWGTPGTQCREIDCYSVSSGVSDVEGVAATYIATPATISDTASPAVPVGSVVPNALIPALEWLIAARTFGARGDANHAAICQQNAQNLLV